MQEENQKISDPYAACRGEEEAVWVLCQADGGAQSKDPQLFFNYLRMELAIFDDSPLNETRMFHMLL